MTLWHILGLVNTYTKLIPTFCALHVHHTYQQVHGEFHQDFFPWYANILLHQHLEVWLLFYDVCHLCSDITYTCAQYSILTVSISISLYSHLSQILMPFDLYPSVPYVLDISCLDTYNVWSKSIETEAFVGLLFFFILKFHDFN